MGRYRVTASAGKANPRSKKRKAASSERSFETMASGMAERKKALYHCNYCNTDITGLIHMKCTICADFDLCVECFSVGVEVSEHKSSHPYWVKAHLSFPLTCSDWNADEEILLLEGIDMYGPGNWSEISEHVATKSKAQCMDHFTEAYMNSPFYPLPDMSYVNRKNKELRANMESDCKKAPSVLGIATPRAENQFTPSGIKVDSLLREAPTERAPSVLTVDGDIGESKISNALCDSTNALSTDSCKKVYNMVDGTNIEGLTSSQDPQIDKRVSSAKPTCQADVGVSLSELGTLSGYNPKRQEFDPEYDNDAEQALNEMEFKDSDCETERELKLRVLQIYLSRLNERKWRKDFILERNLLFAKSVKKELSGEDREVHETYKVFMRFHSQEDHEALVQSVIEENKIRRRLQELRECRAAGCHSMEEARSYIEKKRKRESEANAQNVGDSSQIVSSENLAKAHRAVVIEKGETDGSHPNTIHNHKINSAGLEASNKVTSSMIVGRDTYELDITGLPAAELLTENERQFCCQNRLLPSQYLKIQEVLMEGIFKGTIVKKSDVYSFFKVDPNKVDMVYDIVMKKLGQI